MADHAEGPAGVPKEQEADILSKRT
jgi:hypothetical protein